MSPLALQASGAAFLASLVEFVEALTVVLAVGATRGWPSAVAGSGAALCVLAALVVAFGPALLLVPTRPLQLCIGLLLLLFGLRWLRKAILRAAGLLKLHDEAGAYAEARAKFTKTAGATAGWDRIAFLAAFNIVMLEGIEVVFIVLSVGAAGGLLAPAAGGAAVALVLVGLAGVAVHRPVAAIPENSLKFVVGIVLCSFGTFWTGEALGAAWPAGDAAVPVLLLCWAIAALGCVRLAKHRSARA